MEHPVHQPQAAVRTSAGAGPWAVGGLGLALTAYVGLGDPTSGGAFVPCPFHAVTGLWCPGCGLTRAVHHLTRLDVGAALGSNLLLPLVAVVAVWVWLAWVSPRVPRPTRVVPPWGWGVLVAVALAFGVARNLPFEPLRALAP